MKKLDLKLNESDLTATQFAQLRGIPTLKELALDMSDCPNVTNIDPVLKLGDLTTLTLKLRNSGVAILHPNSNLKRLTLGLEQRHVAQLSSIERFTSLTDLTLDFGFSKDLRNLPSFHNFRSVTTLTLNLYDTEVRDLGPLAPMQKLTSLTLVLEKPLSLAPLRRLTKLSELNLNVRYEANEEFLNELVALLTSLTSLEAVKLDLPEIVDWTALQGIQNLKLKRLTLVCGHPVTTLTLPENLPQLEELTVDLSATMVDELKGLENINCSLKRLTLRLGDKVTKLTLPKRLSQLEELAIDLSRTNVHGLEAFENIPNQLGQLAIELDPEVTVLTLPKAKELRLTLVGVEFSDRIQTANVPSDTKLHMEIKQGTENY